MALPLQSPCKSANILPQKKNMRKPFYRTDVYDVYEHPSEKS
jgi:hypothetical protein